MDHIRNQLDRFDNDQKDQSLSNCENEASDNAENIIPFAGHAYLGAAQQPVSIFTVMATYSSDPAFIRFPNKLAACLNPLLHNLGKFTHGEAWIQIELSEQVCV